MEKEFKYSNVYIAGIHVNSANCNNITGWQITAGSVSYDFDTHTLILDNAMIKGGLVFNHYHKDITITLIGRNKCEFISYTHGIKIINGRGSLEVGHIDCRTEKNTIIEDCNISIIRQEDYALYGEDSKLTIKNANIFTTGEMFAIGWFDDIELIDCEIIEPTNAQIIDKIIRKDGMKYAGKYICDADGTVAKKVVIRRK